MASEMGIPQRIIIKLNISINSFDLPALSRMLGRSDLSEEDIKKVAVQWATEYKEDLEKMPGIQVNFDVEEVI